jgi:5-(carboxyamino)imidazole ribonucleotide mutase
MARAFYALNSRNSQVSADGVRTGAVPALSASRPVSSTCLARLPCGVNLGFFFEEPSMPPLVGIIMGSRSDLTTMREAATVLSELGIPHEMRIVSAHRTPDLMFRYAESARERGLRVIIAGAGGAAHLPGMTAAKTMLPVIGVPIQSRALNGIDSLLSIAQMPAGVPVATVAIGNAGNAALLAARILALNDPELEKRLAARREQTARMVESEKIDEGSGVG